jgi:hypothetical protein
MRPVPARCHACGWQGATPQQSSWQPLGWACSGCRVTSNFVRTSSCHRCGMPSPGKDSGKEQVKQGGGKGGRAQFGALPSPTRFLVGGSRAVAAGSPKPAPWSRPGLAPPASHAAASGQAPKGSSLADMGCGRGCEHVLHASHYAGAAGAAGESGPATAQAKAALQLRIAAVDSAVVALAAAGAASMCDPAIEHVLGGKRAEAAAIRDKALKPLRVQAQAAVPPTTGGMRRAKHVVVGRELRGHLGPGLNQMLVLATVCLGPNHLVKSAVSVAKRRRGDRERRRASVDRITARWHAVTPR